MSIYGVALHFYMDSGNGPGEEIGSTSMLAPTSVEFIGNPVLYDRLEVSVELDEAITFIGSSTEIIYWIGVIIDYSGADSFMEVTNNLNSPKEIYLFNSDTGNWISGSDGFGMVLDGIIAFYGLCGEIISCTGQPIAGTIDGPENVCADKGFTLDVSGQSQAGGINYQWQQSANSGFTWTNIVGQMFPFSISPMEFLIHKLSFHRSM